MRYTKTFLRHQVDVINAMLGNNSDAIYRPGAIVLYSAYGGYGVHRISAHGSGRDTLLPCVSSRECARFLAGMIAAVEISRGQR